MPSVIVVGAQWGDEGKGKIIDVLSANAQHVVRSQGGNNAGHTIVIAKEEFKLNLIPSGILNPHSQCYISAGTVIDPEVLICELKNLQSRGVTINERLWISPQAHVIFPFHKSLDILLEQQKSQDSVGTTGKGIGPCYADKANRIGIRIGELIRPELFSKALKNILALKNAEIVKVYGGQPFSFEAIYEPYSTFAEYLAPFVANAEELVYSAIKSGNHVLFEGAQGTFLDVTLGTYPFVTSSNTGAAGICIGAGIGPKDIDHVLGVIKAYTTRVGNGPFPTELKAEEAFLDHLQAREFGTTTGRKRRIGWFDSVLAKASVRFNSLTSLAVTKLDILDHLDKIKICVGYEVNGKKTTSFPSMTEDLEKAIPIYDILPGWKTSTSAVSTYKELPEAAKKYLKTIEDLCEVPVSIISTGPERDRTIILKNPFTS